MQILQQLVLIEKNVMNKLMKILNLLTLTYVLLKKGVKSFISLNLNSSSE